ncbi:MAG TPA: TrkA C-terminal domain-containing protein [Candidatus Hydrogenedentes bacterium]|nr:TrkA C-terminal domain-containing protein [Candidatus Hydrogenedentota bacterium]
MEALKTFLEQQSLLSMFLVIGLGYALGAVNIRGFALGIGAVLFVGLGVGMLAPQAAPPALLGSLGLVMFVYGIGIQYGKQFFGGLTSPFGLKANGLALFSHLAALGVCYVAYATFAVAPTHVAGLFCGALTSTPALQAAIGAAGNSDPALGYSVAYPFGVIGPILCMYFANLWLKPKFPAVKGTGLDLREIVVRNAQVIGRPLAEVNAALPAGVQIVLVREGHQNRVPAPDIVLDHDDVVAVAGESAEALEKAEELIGKSAQGRITKDRLDLDYFRLFVSRSGVVGVRLGDLRIAGGSEFSVVHVRRGDADLLPRPELVLEFGDRVGVMARRQERDAVRAYFGDSIKGTTEFSYISLGVGMALGVLLGILPIPVPGLGTLALGVAGGPLVMALILGRFGRTGGWVWTMPVSANITLRNFGLTLFLAQVGMVSGPKFIATLEQMGPLFLGLGAAIVLGAVLINMLVGHFLLRLRFDDLLGVTAGVAANPAILAFGSKLVTTDRTDIAYATTFPAATITKIVLVQVMLAMMGTP